MSDRDFDNYLTFLASLLRLGRQQREQIAKELRAHLDDRLEELLAEGVSREEAIERALVEFGDAAGLAGEFASIARGRNRRWLMRVTTFSVAATILIAAGLITFWPGRNAGPGVAQVAAQNEGQDDDKTKETPRKAADFKPISVEDKLAQRVDAEFMDVPLSDVFEFLQTQTGVQFYLKLRAMEEVGVPTDVPVTKHLKQVRLSTLLELMLEELDLTYVERDDDLVLITTPEDAETTMVIRVYDCRDLLAMPWPEGGAPRRPQNPEAGGFFGGDAATGDQGSTGALTGADVSQAQVTTAPFILAQLGGSPFGGGQFGGQGGSGGLGGGGGLAPGGMGQGLPAPEPTEYENRVHALVELITMNVDPDSWADMGGPGSISEYAGLVVVTQTAQTHKKVERVLDMLRQAAGLEKPEGGGVVR